MPKTPQEEAGVQTLWVKAAPELHGKVALWERHPDHPHGEVYVAGDKPVEVARTGEVLLRLRNKTLIEVDKPKASELREMRETEEKLMPTTAEGAARIAGGSAETGSQHTSGQPEQSGRKGTGTEKPTTKTP